MRFLAFWLLLGLMLLSFETSAAGSQGVAATQGGAGDSQQAKMVGDRLRYLSEKLGLTEDQKTKIKPILQEEASKLKSIRDDKSLSDETKRAKIGEQLNQTSAKIKPILNPQQAVQLEKMKQDAAKRRGRGHR